MNGNTYWLSWIENGSDGRARAIFKSDSYMTFEKAVEDMERVRESDKVVCAWIDCFGPDKQPPTKRHGRDLNNDWNAKSAV